MTGSLILRTTARLLLPLLLLCSVFVLLRGHNEPGGGFIGGLLAAGGFALYMLAWGRAAMLEVLRLDPRTLTGVGLVLALAAAVLPLLGGHSFFTGLWLPLSVPGVGKLSSVLLFDVGVYLVVIGTTLVMIDVLGPEESP